MSPATAASARLALIFATYAVIATCLTAKGLTLGIGGWCIGAWLYPLLCILHLRAVRYPLLQWQTVSMNVVLMVVVANLLLLSAFMLQLDMDGDHEWITFARVRDMMMGNRDKGKIESWVGDFDMWWLNVAMFVPSATTWIILVRLGGRLKRWSADSACHACGFPLRGASRCPECGREPPISHSR